MFSELNEADRIEVLRYLVALLPTANSDTLLVLLKFLQDVVQHSYDTIDDQGVAVRKHLFIPKTSFQNFHRICRQFYKHIPRCSLTFKKTTND